MASRRNGTPSNSRSRITTVAIGIGRRMTVVATRCQTPSPTGLGSRCRKIRTEFTFVPSTASIAGSTTTAPSAASSATAMPA